MAGWKGFVTRRPSAEDAPLAVEQLRLALANLAPNAYVTPVFATVICVMFAPWVGVPRLIAWWLLVAMGGAPLGIVCAKFLRNTPKEMAAVRLWTKLAVGAHLMFAVSWSSMGLFLWAPGSDLNHLLVLIILAGTLAANMALSGASRPLTINGYAVHGVTFVLLPLREGTQAYYGLSLLAFLFVVYLLSMSNQIYSTARRMLMLAHEKNDLIEQKNRLIAELSDSQRESERARSESERANRSKSQFLANMSHELRTPLNAILGFSEMISAGIAREKTNEYAGIIHGAGSHLLALINDVLDLSKIEAGRFVLHETTLDLGALIADCAAVMQPRAKVGRLTLVHSAFAELANVYADERALRQILLNLMSNAMKFTKADGEVRVDGTITEAGEICLSVRDTGVGIAEEDLDRVFDSFGQGRHDIAIEEKTTGLGLAIVKGLAEAHAGRVTLESSVGLGTCVRIFLPADRVRERERERKLA